MSTNNTTPLWVFFLMTAVSVLLTSMILALLRWLENGEETPVKQVITVLLGPFVAISAPRELRRDRDEKTFDTSKYHV